MSITQPLFPLGRIVATSHLLAVVSNHDIQIGLNRHMIGDWGELDQGDREANDRAVLEASRILSAYDSSEKVRFWIITEWDRSSTTVLLPEDY